MSDVQYPLMAIEEIEQRAADAIASIKNKFGIDLTPSEKISISWLGVKIWCGGVFCAPAKREDIRPLNELRAAAVNMQQALATLASTPRGERGTNQDDGTILFRGNPGGHLAFLIDHLLPDLPSDLNRLVQICDRTSDENAPLKNGGSNKNHAVSVLIREARSLWTSLRQRHDFKSDYSKSTIGVVSGDFVTLVFLLQNSIPPMFRLSERHLGNRIFSELGPANGGQLKKRQTAPSITGNSI